MSFDLLITGMVLIMTLVLFITGKIPFDFVALLALFIVAVFRIIPLQEIFAGFSHPAVITVACVLVVSRGLLNGGIVDLVANLVSKVGEHRLIIIATLCVLVALCSAFMNNVGALSLFLPVALTICKKQKIPPAQVLMPLSFASLLGGMTTLIGTPPNIIIATFRGEQKLLNSFKMFDFTAVGGIIALLGLLFIIFIGVRLIPQRKASLASGAVIEIASYLTEISVDEKAKVIGQRLDELEYDRDEMIIVGLIRGKERYPAPYPYRTIQQGDILIVKADAEDLQEFIDKYDLQIAESEEFLQEQLGSEEIALLEAVVTPEAAAVGKTAKTLNLRRIYGVNLLALSREKGISKGRVASIKIKSGDVLLLQGPQDAISEMINSLGLLPLAERNLRLGQPRRVLISLMAFAVGIGLSLSGLLPIQIALLGVVLFYVLAGFVKPKEAYESIDWRILVLLGSMFPLSQALEASGGTGLIAKGILDLSQGLGPVLALIIVFVGTMFLSDLINNAAATVLMAPIAFQIATSFAVSPDPFLMAVAISASCAFLTPIGHQSNTLVMGPGGYRFGDYWKMGLPLEVIIVLTAIPLLLIFWPL